MRKRLTRHGNSLVLVIDKPIRSLMQLSPSLEVELQFDGARLLVEAVPADIPTTKPTSILMRDRDRLPQSLITDAERVVLALFKRFGMEADHVQQIYPGFHPRFIRLIGWAQERERLKNADSFERGVVRRIHVCHEQLLLGKSWAEAISIALQTWPVGPLPPQADTNAVRTAL